MKVDIKMLSVCDELWVFGELISSGMATEIENAKKFKIPICFINKDIVLKAT